jgi:ATP synthase protein I
MVDTRNEGGGDRGKPAPSSDGATLSARLSGLNKRLSKVRNDRDVEASEAANEDAVRSRASAMAVGLRLSSELVAGVLVGAAIGWGFDRLLSTSPWGLIVFLLLGFAAGVINVMRSAGAIPKQSDRI